MAEADAGELLLTSADRSRPDGASPSTDRPVGEAMSFRESWTALADLHPVPAAVVAALTFAGLSTFVRPNASMSETAGLMIAVALGAAVGCLARRGRRSGTREQQR